MSDKKRTSISVDKDVYHFLQQNEVNQSGLINELVKEYRDNQDRQVAALELRYKHLVDERDSAREKAKEKDRQAKEVKALLDDARETESETMQQARDAIGNLTPMERKPHNQAVQYWAGELDMDPETLLQELGYE